MIPPIATGDAPRVLFLADAGLAVGGGHVMRCLTLAGALSAKGAVCAFVAPPAVTAILETFGGDAIQALPAPGGDAASLAQAAADLAKDWSAEVVVLDHYGLGAAEEAGLRDGGRKIAVLDDLANRAHACGLLIDPGLGRSDDDYRGLVPPDARVVTGPDYALVRPAFAAARKAALARRGERRSPGRALVSLGLTDVGGITARAVQAIQPALGEVALDVVLGAGAASLPALSDLAARDPRIEVHVDVRDMAALMASADIAIGAGGSSVWERACLGLPSILLVLADNQRVLARELDRRGAAVTVDARRVADLAPALPKAWERLIADRRQRTSLVYASSSLCDGLGAERSAEAVLDLLR
jgi:UDP-2,4-diacetamido-2,4,6-trideoxy-beta-L-altropyranose hydrolase